MCVSNILKDKYLLFYLFMQSSKQLDFANRSEKKKKKKTMQGTKH